MGEEMKEVTLRQLLEIAVEQLNSIVVPVSMIDQVAIPIKRVVNNLKVGINAIDNAPAKQEEVPEIIEEEVVNE